MSHAVLVAAMLGLALHSGDRPPAHPADGPDIDVRLRIGPGGVTMALLLNLAFVDEVVDTPRESETALHPVEYESYHQDLAAHFLATNRVEIDGVEVTAEVGSFEVGEPDLTLLPLFPRMGVKALLKMRLLLEYPASAAPERVSVVWGTFPDDLVLDFGGGAPPMNINVQVVARGVREHVLLSTEEPGYTWHDTGASALDAFDPVPLVEASTPPGVGVPLIGVGALCAGVGLGWLALRQRRRPLLVASLAMFGAAALGRDAGRVELPLPFAGPSLPTADEALAIFTPLQRNVYRAFEFVDESEIYDALARSVHGDLLDRLYRQVYQSLILHEEGGAVSQVEEVRTVDNRVEQIGLLGEEEWPGFTVHSRWQVDGAVYHWGHSHARTQEYEARYTVARTPTGWRIRDHEILAQEVIATSSTDPRAAGGGR